MTGPDELLQRTSVVIRQVSDVLHAVGAFLQTFAVEGVARGRA
jgi:hypothetical protein